MPEEKKEKLSQRDRQIARIDQLKKQLQKEEAKLREDARKERNRQIVAFGIFMEITLRDSPMNDIKNFKMAFQNTLTGRNLDLALAGMKRILKEKELASSKKEVSQEPPSQPSANSADPQV